MFQFISSLRDGFTFDLANLQFIQSGIVVAYSETQNCFGFRGFVKAFMHARFHANVLGGWYNHQNGRFYFDSCRVFTNRSAAIEFGRQHQQIAIFDLDNLEEIRL